MNLPPSIVVRAFLVVAESIINQELVYRQHRGWDGALVDMQQLRERWEQFHGRVRFILRSPIIDVYLGDCLKTSTQENQRDTFPSRIDFGSPYRFIDIPD